MVVYVPGTSETDPKKQNRSLQQLGGAVTAAAAAAAASVQAISAGSGGVSVTGTSTNPVVNVTRVSGANMLRNTNWQLFSGLVASSNSTSAINVFGTGTQNSVTVSSFSTTNNQPTCFTSNTQALYNGCLVVFGAGLGGFSGWALRVFGLVANTSFKVQLPFGTVSPGASSVITAFPMGIGDPGISTNGPDPWTKTASLVMWADDFAANYCPGAKRVLGLRLSAGGGANFNYVVDSDDLPSLRGRTISIGARLQQKVSAGTTPRLFISDGISVAYSAYLTGSGFVDAANNNYEFATASLTVSPSCASLTVGIEWLGSIGDIIYLATPTLKYGSVMTADDLGQPFNEQIIANQHWNPPSLVPLATTFPAAELIATTGLYGWAGLDIEALSYGQCHSSVRKINAKIESNCATVGQIIFVGAMNGDLTTAVPLTFGLQACTPVASKEIDTNMSMVPLRVGPTSYGSPPGCFVIFGNISAGVINALTFDFDDVMG